MTKCNGGVGEEPGVCPSHIRRRKQARQSAHSHL
jgi:hypothetical protein